MRTPGGEFDAASLRAKMGRALRESAGLGRSPTNPPLSAPIFKRTSSKRVAFFCRIRSLSGVAFLPADVVQAA